MTDLREPFSPDWVSPPGETVLDMAEERGWSQVELARRLGYTQKHVSQLVNGKVPLSVDAALRLERVLGSPAEFWLSREASYQKRLASQQAVERHAGESDWLEELPVKDLMACGTLPKLRVDAKNKPAIVEACLRFFGVASPEDWRQHYGALEVAFRRTRKEQCDLGAISAWLRLGEQQAEKVEIPSYDKAKFEQALAAIRGLTRLSPSLFEPEMRRLLREAGVLMIIVPSIPRAHVSGVARWLSTTQPLIQISLYGRHNDRFWFTFFHEAAHILLHADNAKDRRSVFLDDPNASHTVDPQEREANRWAADFLIPPKCSNRLLALRSRDAVLRFANEIGIHPGIVVGRLQYDGLIPPSWMNELKERIEIQSGGGIEVEQSRRLREAT